jgi:tetratricopeptide (TPR) repeat protein
LFVALASLYVTNEQPDEALEALERAEPLTQAPELISEIERLRLLAEEPDFEARIGAIVDVLNTGTRLPETDLEFLEDIVERAPSYADAYLHLAKGYERIDEPAAMLETLLDGQKNVPDDPEISYLLVRTLWDQDQRELALEYLNKALSANPYHVPLLALAGRYLFEEGDEDEARDFLSRAEAISPNHPVLNEVRRFIARELDEE